MSDCLKLSCFLLDEYNPLIHGDLIICVGLVDNNTIKASVINTINIKNPDFEVKLPNDKKDNEQLQKLIDWFHLIRDKIKNPITCCFASGSIKLYSKLTVYIASIGKSYADVYRSMNFVNLDDYKEYNTCSAKLTFLNDNIVDKSLIVIRILACKDNYFYANLIDIVNNQYDYFQTLTDNAYTIKK